VYGVTRHVRYPSFPPATVRRFVPDPAVSFDTFEGFGQIVQILQPREWVEAPTATAQCIMIHENSEDSQSDKF
jgi:hypothetical protein